MKKKKILLIVLPIVLVIVIAAVFAILYFATDMFKATNQTFWKYFSKNVQVFSLLENENKDLQKQFKQTNSYASNGTLTFSMQNGEANPQTIDIITTSRRDNISGRIYADATLKNQETEILKVSYINSDDVYAIKCDEVLKNYIGFRNSNLKEFAKNMGSPENTVALIPDTIDLSAIEKLFQLTDTEKQHIIDTYSKIIINTIPETQYKKIGKQTITIGGSQQNANVYQLTLTGEMLKQIMINCLTSLKSDSATLVSISSRLEILGWEKEEMDITNIASNIEEQINQLQNQTIEETIVISVYEQKGKTIRTVIESANTGKITIDLQENKVTLTMEQYLSNNGEDNTQNNNTMQIVLSKIKSQANTTNTITIIPDISNMAQNITTSVSLGSIQNSNINNSYNISINNAEETSTSTIDLSYDTSISAVTQVDEIMELKNSNTVIINNYTKEQLMPFLQNIIEKTQQVLENKMQILGTSLINQAAQSNNEGNSNENGITNQLSQNNMEI